MDEDNKPEYPRGSLPDLVLNGLGYCCLWAFFKLYRSPTVISFRLGLNPRTVREWKSRHTAGEFQCSGRCDGRCLKAAVRLKERKRKGL